MWCASNRAPCCLVFQPLHSSSAQASPGHTFMPPLPPPQSNLLSITFSPPPLHNLHGIHHPSHLSPRSRIRSIRLAPLDAQSIPKLFASESARNANNPCSFDTSIAIIKCRFRRPGNASRHAQCYGNGSTEMAVEEMLAITAETAQFLSEEERLVEKSKQGAHGLHDVAAGGEMIALALSKFVYSKFNQDASFVTSSNGNQGLFSCTAEREAAGTLFRALTQSNSKDPEQGKKDTGVQSRHRNRRPKNEEPTKEAANEKEVVGEGSIYHNVSSGNDGHNKEPSTLESGTINRGRKENLERFDMDEEEDSLEHLTKIPVPRQKYIPVSKVDLVTTLLQAFNDDTKAAGFLSVCSCLEAILHAEHKRILEELRLDYKMTRSFTQEMRQNGLVKDIEPNIQSCSTQVNKTVKTDFIRSKSKQVSPEESGDQVPIKTRRDLTKIFLGQTEQPSSVSTMNGSVSESFLSGREDIEASMLEENPLPSSNNQVDPVSSNCSKVTESCGDISVAGATRFQRNFMQLLRSAQFQGLSARDLQLTSALNTDYLLTLPIDVDWKQASSANAIIFRRGYSAERQEGLLFGEKFDYLQSLLLRKIFNWFSKPLFKAGISINQKWKQLAENEDSRIWTQWIKEWLKEPLEPDAEDDLAASLGTQDLLISDSYPVQETKGDLPIWIAAKQAVPRYESFLSSAGSRGLLLRKFLVWIRVLPSKSAELLGTVENNSFASEPHLRNNQLTRISMRDIWLPASKAVCGNNIWKSTKAAFSVFFSRSTLQEPAFKELVLLYNDSKGSNGDIQGEGILNLQVKVYKRIPIPDLKVIFPFKKLSFRILDTVRLDVATFVGLLAFIVNYRFDDILSSPSAFLLDVIATSALLVYVTRVVLGYKQTWDRYQLLVNTTLYEKTLASGFGAIHFLVDASEQQKFKEAVLVYALLTQTEQAKVESRKKLADMCERFLCSHFKEQIEMPVDDALELLLRLGIVVEYGPGSTTVNGGERTGTIEALPCPRSAEILKDRWSELLYDQSVWSAN